MARLVRRKCPCLRPKMEEEVRVLDYRHSSLADLPGEVFSLERTLEELHADCNQIRDLPRELFYCHGLRKLSISDNEITTVPPAIASLDHLEELDFSKNGIIDVPDNIKCCKYLRVLDASVNPLGKLPEGFTQLQNLTHLYLNDTFLDYLPGSFGRLVKLRILEMRENHLKTLPKSFGRLTELERLDIGQNEFTELPDVVGSLTKLVELWCDNNQITSLTHTMGCLKQLMFLDASKNLLESLPGEMEGCGSLADLHLTTNQLHTLPESIGHLNSLTTLKVDDNQLTSLPSSLGGLTSLSELNVSVNDLEELPASIGLLRNLRTFYADENLLAFLPAELGSCSGITVLSVRGNRLTYVPDELGRIPRLRVLNLSDNRLAYLPFTVVKLKELQALWLTENQTRPLIPLQSDYEPETGRKILTCYLLPQGRNSDSEENVGGEDSDSFHPSVWEEERLQRQQIHFNFGDDEDDEGHLVRCPTPYPREMKEKARHMRNLALRQTVGDSSQPPCRSPQSPPPGHAHHHEEGGMNSYPGPEERAIDVPMEEARAGGKPQSPSLQETHRLYRYEKEKLMREKARMQPRHSTPVDESLYSLRSPAKRGDSLSGTSDLEEGRVAGRRQSTPNLFSFEGQAPADGKAPRRMPSFTYEDLYQRRILRKHHHHRHGRRSRRLRDYDSDTGYRSDKEVSFRRPHKSDNSVGDGGGGSCTDLKDDLSVRSQPVMSRSRGQGRGKDGGDASDVEAYAGQGRGGSGRGRRGHRNAVTPSPVPRAPRQPRAGSTPSPCRELGSSASLVQDRATPPRPRPQSCLTVPAPARPRLGSRAGSVGTPSPSPSPSPSPLSAGKALPEPGPPLTSQTVRRLPPGCVSASPSPDGQDSGGGGLRAELRLLQSQGRSVTPASAGGSGAGAVRQTPPPYQPAPPYRRPSERSDSSSGVPRSPPGSDLPNSTSFFSSPEYASLQDGHAAAARPAFPDRLHHQQQQCDSATAERDRAESHVPAGAGPSPARTSHPQGGAAGDWAPSYDYNGRRGGPQTPGPRGDPLTRGDGRSFAQDLSVSSAAVPALVGGGGHGYDYTPTTTFSSSPAQTVPPPGSRPPFARPYPDRSPDSLTPLAAPAAASAHFSDSDSSSRHSSRRSHSSAAPPRARSGAGQNVPGGQTKSGVGVVPRTPLERYPNSSPKPLAGLSSSGSSQRVFEADPSASPRTLEAYPNPYGEPLEVGDPLMNRYEDVAVFKSMQDPSQVSSSTDSGYGHGQQIYERIGDFGARRSGSPYSSTPSHRDTPVRQSGSSQGTPSRETTPVREEVFCGLQSAGAPPEFFTTQESREVFRTVIHKRPGLGFSIAGGSGCQNQNPFRPGDCGIFVTKVQPGGPAASLIQPGDKLLQVNHVDFSNIDHTTAVNVLKTSSSVDVLVERVQRVNLV